ncbi:hypothetical protein [Nocardia sp. NPDC051750]|uniref:hypothetical protein n=1 Tax=Nocardia sp. NPDC051750 TaxID=3364325 RepID=UPI00379CC53D
MSPPRNPLRPSDFRWVIALLAGVVGGVAGLIWLRCVHLVLTSRFATDPLADPHGYGLIFGTVWALPAATVTAAVLPFAFPGRYRARVTKLATPVLVVVTVLLFVALFTA